MKLKLFVMSLLHLSGTFAWAREGVYIEMGAGVNQGVSASSRSKSSGGLFNGEANDFQHDPGLLLNVAWGTVSPIPCGQTCAIHV